MAGRFTPTVGESEKDQHSWSASQRENRIFSSRVNKKLRTLFGFEIDDCIHGSQHRLRSRPICNAKGEWQRPLRFAHNVLKEERDCYVTSAWKFGTFNVGRPIHKASATKVA